MTSFRSSQASSSFMLMPTDRADSGHMRSFDITQTPTVQSQTTITFLSSSTHQTTRNLEQIVEQDIVRKKPTHNSVLRTCIVIFALLCLAILVFTPMFHKQHYSAQKCLALVVFVAILWTTEAIPLWVTSLTIPFLSVILGILSDDDRKQASSILLGDLMSPTVVLILGGFTIARALNKYHLDKRLAIFVLSYAGRDIKRFLLAVMVLGAFMSMWVSNVAAPVLMVFLVSPVLNDISQPAAKCLALGIAFSCNVGGMLTPISSPQNAVALGFIDKDPDVHDTITFIDWIGAGVLIGALGILFSWAFLLAYYKPDSKELPTISKEGLSKLTWFHWYVLAVSLITVGLWCTFQGTADVFGELGVIALIPVIFLFGTDVLDSDDLKSIDWQILILLGGGVALGDSVSASGLLDLIATGIREISDDVFMVYAIFSLITMIISNFISHTVAAITIIQVVEEVGKNFGHPRALTFGAVLCCSAASCLPVSGFPNVVSYSIKNDEGERILSTRDYVISGIPFQIFIYLLVISIEWVVFKQFGY